MKDQIIILFYFEHSILTGFNYEIDLLIFLSRNQVKSDNLPLSEDKPIDKFPALIRK